MVSAPCVLHIVSDGVDGLTGWQREGVLAWRHYLSRLGTQVMGTLGGSGLQSVVGKSGI